MLVDASEPGALNLCRAFRQEGHEVTLLHRGRGHLAGHAETLELSKATAVHDVYPGAWRREREGYVLNSVGHRAAQAGLGALAKPFLLPAFDARLARPAQERVVRLVKDTGAEVVVSFWGIGAMPEQRALQRAKAPVAQVLQFQTYPLGKAPFARPKPASPIEREVLGRLDGRIHASAQMEHYLDAALRPVRGIDIVLPEAWGPWACAGRQRLPKLSDADGKVHVVHIGVPPAQPGTADDVTAQLEAIAAQGIEVHAAEGFTSPRIRTFPRLGVRALLTGEVATFLTQFDALVLLYNVTPGLQWYAGNMPARFLSAISAGLPVAVPRGIFGAVQDFVQREGDGFVFDGAQDLTTRLRDKEAMGRARKLAEALEREHRLDKFVPKYQQVLEQALALRAGRPPGPSDTLK